MFINWFKPKSEFDKYIDKYNIDCKCPIQREKMRKAYMKNIEWIRNSGEDYVVGETIFTGLDRDTFKQMNKTKEDNIYPGFFAYYYSRLLRTMESDVENQIPGLPKSIDWSQKYVSPVVEQGDCGACWSFAATGAVESAVAIKNNKDIVNLSEQHLIDCIPPDYGNDKCEGGIVRRTLQFIKEREGVCIDDDYKYVSGKDCKKNTCLAGPCKPCVLKPIQMNYECLSGEDNLIRQLQKGPVTAIINSSPLGIQNYKGGIFNIKDVITRNKFLTAQHGVLVVGYGEEYGRKYWKIKNSWGDNWGEKGYFRIQRGEGTDIGLLGVARQNCLVTIK